MMGVAPTGRPLHSPLLPPVAFAAFAAFATFHNSTSAPDRTLRKYSPDARFRRARSHRLRTEVLTIGPKRSTMVHDAS